MLKEQKLFIKLNHTYMPNLKNIHRKIAELRPFKNTKKIVKFMFFSNNFLTTKNFITTKEQIRWKIAFYIKTSNLKKKYWFLRALWAFEKIQDGRQNIQNWQYLQFLHAWCIFTKIMFLRYSGLQITFFKLGQTSTFSCK